MVTGNTPAFKVIYTVGNNYIFKHINYIVAPTYKEAVIKFTNYCNTNKIKAEIEELERAENRFII